MADANALDLTTGMTLHAWVYPIDHSGARNVIIEQGASADICILYPRN